MQPTLTLTVSGLSPQKAEALLAALNSNGGSEETETADFDSAPAASKPNRKSAKSAKASKQDADDFDSETEDFDTEEEQAEETEISKADLNKALKMYSRKNGHEKAMKLLKKYKAKSLNDLDESDYASLMEDLG